MKVKYLYNMLWLIKAVVCLWCTSDLLNDFSWQEQSKILDVCAFSVVSRWSMALPPTVSESRCFSPANFGRLPGNHVGHRHDRSRCAYVGRALSWRSIENRPSPNTTTPRFGSKFAKCCQSLGERAKQPRKMEITWQRDGKWMFFKR